MACHHDAPRVVDETYAVLDMPSLPEVAKDTAAVSLRAKQIKAELQYYLSRHNVDDEGFDMVARYGEEGDSTLSAFMPKGHTSPLSQLHLRTLPRRGKGIAHDSLGRIIIGKWDADTLVSGIRIDSAGIYAGQLNRHMKAEGHGSYRSVDGAYYEGHWENDLREDFGLQLLENDVLTVLKTGLWQKDVFKGERMNYTSERIYGIDISRYQHGKGRKQYPIHWQNLRISHLGSKSQKKISGVVDYPVSFCYIKSTEGISIRNKYYATDYAAARKHGIQAGAYHFFSTRTSGSAQAKYFIASTLFRKGDLPPVLDIEPSDGDIAKMGGAQALFSNIRAWLQAVEKFCGVKPILYINQRFVNKWLPEAPDIKRDYKVWIARYGEYKPDVKLVVWQLSPDGRVKGITGEVDINVFNGYQAQFDEFIEKETIR